MKIDWKNDAVLEWFIDEGIKGSYEYNLSKKLLEVLQNSMLMDRTSRRLS